MMKEYEMKKLLLTLTATLSLTATSVFAGPVAIINGSSGTSEPGTTSSITDQITMLHQAVGNTVSVFDVVPMDLSSYDQVWDIRFSNNLAISTAEQAQFLTYLQAGGGMFVMGENSSFTQRNNSVLALIDAAGGGSLNFVSPISSQTVLAPFTGPNAVTTVNYSAPGGVDGNGTGDWITVDANGNGTGVAWGTGDLSNAVEGALTTIFDVNFMQTNAEEPSQNLTANLIGFIENEVNPVSAPAIAFIMFAGVSGLLFRHKKRAGSAL